MFVKHDSLPFHFVMVRKERITIHLARGVQRSIEQCSPSVDDTIANRNHSFLVRTCLPLASSITNKRKITHSRQSSNFEQRRPITPNSFSRYSCSAYFSFPLESFDPVQIFICPISIKLQRKKARGKKKKDHPKITPLLPNPRNKHSPGIHSTPPEK